jgi:lysophospholipase L1-like esterase
MMQLSRRWIRYGRGVSLLLAAWTIVLVPGLVALELLFGGWLRSDPWERAYALHIIVERRLVFDASPLYPGGGDVLYTRDRYGLRGAYGKVEDVKILAVGGSTTDQRYVPDGQTWQDVLQAQLGRSGIRAPVANAGVDGHSTFAHLAAYRDWLPLIPGLKPRYTILYVGINDLHLDAPRMELEGATDGRPDWKARIKGNSALYRLYGTLQGMARAKRTNLGHSRVDFAALRYTSEPRVPGAVALDAASRAGFIRRLQALLDRVKAQGSTPVCVTQPMMAYRPTRGGGVGVEEALPVPNAPPAGFNGVDAGRILRARDAVMREACEAADAPFIDLGGMDWETGDFYDYIHNTPAGARKIGERLAEAMNHLPF